MTYNVLMGALNPTHSLTTSIPSSLPPSLSQASTVLHDRLEEKISPPPPIYCDTTLSIFWMEEKSQITKLLQ